MSKKDLLIAWCYTGFFAVTLPLLSYTAQDITDSRPSEVLLLLPVFILLSGLLLSSYLWLKTYGERLVATVLAVYFLTAYYPTLPSHFGGLRNALGTVMTAAIIQACVYVGAAQVAKLCRLLEKRVEARKLAVHPLQTIVKVVCVVVAAMNLYAFCSYIYSHRAATAYNPNTSVSGAESITGTSNRDIYYLVFDRYASNESLKNYFGYDNSEFLNWLTNNGFTVRDNAHSNYQYTAPSISSTLRMGYHDDLAADLPGHQPINYLPYKKIFEKSPTAELLRKQGYDVYNLGNWWNVTKEQSEATNILPEFQATVIGHDFSLSEIQSNVLGNSFMGGFLRRGLTIAGFTVLKASYADNRKLYSQQIADLEMLAKTPHDRPRFVFVHFLSTHPPYVYSSDGSLPDYEPTDDNTGAPRRDKYINQLRYTNSTAKGMIASIKAASKVPPVIIILSDEGPYPLKVTNDWQHATADTLKLKTGVLSAYDLPGVPAQEILDAGASVNIFRLVFNSYFGSSLPYLPDCTRIFNGDDTSFTFHDVTALLHEADKRCG